MRAITRRAIGLAAGVGSFTAAIALSGMGAAQASAPMNGGGGDQGDCHQIGIKYSLDGGHTWTTDGRINGDTAPTTFMVKLQSKAAKGCEYRVSLASYSTEGADWGHSGHQDFLGWDTTKLDRNKDSDTLDVSGVAPTCFGQVDLYGNGIKYDGGKHKGHGPLPYQPGNITTPTNLITAWNGGHECSGTPTGTPTDTASATPTDTASATPTDTASATPTDTASATPTDTASATPTDTASATPTDTASATPTASGSAGTTPPSTTPPSGVPSVPPATGATGNLAETGGNSSQNVAFAGGGAALLVVGGAAVYFTRRRRSGAHS